MSAGKVKNLIILILLLVCGFLLALVLPARLEARQRSEENTRRLRELMAEADVTLDCALPETVDLRAAEIPDTNALYADVVTALLGDKVLSKQTAYRTEYASEYGTLLLSADGFTASLQGREAAADPRAETEALLARFGMTRFTLQQAAEQNTLRIRVSPQLYGVPLFSAELVFTYRDGVLTEVAGLPLRESCVTVTGQKRCCTAQDALVAFWGERLSLGWVGSRVEALSQGFLLTDASRLQPVWRIETDTGAYCVDGLTRTVFRANET